MAFKGFISVLIISALVGLVASSTKFVKVQVHASTGGTCTTAKDGISEMQLGLGLWTLTDSCVAKDQNEEVGNYVPKYEKTTCNATYAKTVTYSDSKCTTVNTSASVEEGPIGCWPSSIADQKFSCDGTTSDTNLVIGMMYRDSACSKTKFKDFMYFDLSICYYGGTASKWYKYKCNATSATAPKLTLDWYTDKACTTLDASLPQIASYGATCAAMAGGGGSGGGSGGNSSNSSNGSRRLIEEEEEEEESENQARRLSSTYYAKLYKGCGYTYSGELPDGVEKPGDSQSSALLSATRDASLSFVVGSAIIALASAFCQG